MDKVLVVEDDVVIEKLIESRLHALGYTVCGNADTAEGALFCAMSLSPDVILMDIHLKGTLDGIDAARIIRKSLPPRIIFLTGLTSPDILQRAKEVHPDGFIEKPFTDTDLRIALTLAHKDPLPPDSPSQNNEGPAPIK
jgi:two-component system, response regulator PdtaR